MGMQKLISAGFATAALASAAFPVFAFTVWPDVDFEWYLDVGQPLSTAIAEPAPAPRAGYIWAPGHYENRGGRQAWFAGQWIKDDFAEQVAAYSASAAALPLNTK
jgi:hypothetical protein